MPIIEYRPELFEALHQMVSRLGRVINLSHRPFVDYYYASHNACKLFLYVTDDGTVLGSRGSELLRCEYKSCELNLNIASNWYSLKRGVGGELSKHAAQHYPGSLGLTFVASRKAVAIRRHYGAKFVPGVRTYFLNPPATVLTGKSWWQRAAKIAWLEVAGRPIADFASRMPAAMRGISVKEERFYSTDLLPRYSPYTFRLASSTEYLGWRYNLCLPFVRYRLFRVLTRGKTTAYVIVNEKPKQLIIAHCDGEDPLTVAYGILLAVLEIGRHDKHPRSVLLASMHHAMGSVFKQFGFKTRSWRNNLPFGFHAPLSQCLDYSDTSNWLINYDWGDNGLQPPFLDTTSRWQHKSSADSSTNQPPPSLARQLENSPVTRSEGGASR